MIPHSWRLRSVLRLLLHKFPEQWLEHPRPDHLRFDRVAREDGRHVVVECHDCGATAIRPAHEPTREASDERAAFDFAEGDGDLRINVHRPVDVASAVLTRDAIRKNGKARRRTARNDEIGPRSPLSGADHAPKRGKFPLHAPALLPGSGAVVLSRVDEIDFVAASAAFVGEFGEKDAGRGWVWREVLVEEENTHLREALHHDRGISADKHARRNFLHDDGARRDDAPLPDFNTGADKRLRGDPRAVAHDDRRCFQIEARSSVVV
jgi:hypothetical protein